MHHDYIWLVWYSKRVYPVGPRGMVHHMAGPDTCVCAVAGGHLAIVMSNFVRSTGNHRPLCGRLGVKKAVPLRSSPSMVDSY